MAKRPCDPIQLRDHNDVASAVLDEAYQRVETGTGAQRARHSPVDELLDNVPTRRVGGSPAAFDLSLQRGSLDLILGGHAGIDRSAQVCGLVHDHVAPVRSTRSPGLRPTSALLVNATLPS